MKKLSIALILLMQLSTVALYAQRRTTINQTAPRKIQFEKLEDYVNDYNKRRNGERLLVSNVPPITKITYDKIVRMYFFNPTENGGYGNTFYTSAAMAKSMRPLLKTDTASMRIACTLIEFVFDSDVDRAAFVTKIEGLDENGKVVWIVPGKAPTKLKFPH